MPPNRSLGALRTTRPSSLFPAFGSTAANGTFTRFEADLIELETGDDALGSVSALLAGLSHSNDENVFEIGRSSDAGELARIAPLESLPVQLRNKLQTFFEPPPLEMRNALASFASGQEFAHLVRDFFARLSYKSLDYYLSFELAITQVSKNALPVTLIGWNLSAPCHSTHLRLHVLSKSLPVAGSARLSGEAKI